MKDRKEVLLKNKMSQEADIFTFTEIFDENEKSQLVCGLVMFLSCLMHGCVFLVID